MELDEITSDLLELALHNWQHAQDPPINLLQLHLLDDSGASSVAERGIHLYDRLVSLTLENLGRHRQAAGLSHSTTPPSTLLALVATLSGDYRVGNAELEAWSALYHRYLAPFSISVDELSTAAHVTSRQFRRRLDTGIARLVDVLRRAEMDAHTRFQSLYLRRHLPPPDYAQLFGIAPLLQKLLSLLSDPNGPRFISIEGLGGIGKTALAQATAERLADRGNLADILWISARHEWITEQGELKPFADPARSLDDVITRLSRQLGQEQLAGLATSDKLEQLKPLLLHTPYLIIIDNLETMIDSQTLIPVLYPLAGASRFLLTSRYTLCQHPYVQIHPLRELSLLDSQILVDSELKRRGQNAVLSEGETNELYDTIGGLPLALKLAAAQMGRLPWANILEGLRRARQETPEKMYHYIYRRTWQLLDDPARQLLLSMLLVSPDGEDVGWLQSISTLPETSFNTAIAQLLNYSLLEVTGPLIAPIYQLHRLTATFLQTEILLHWKDRDAGSL
jgi:hypothetical protein